MYVLTYLIYVARSQTMCYAWSIGSILSSRSSQISSKSKKSVPASSLLIAINGTKKRIERLPIKVVVDDWKQNAMPQVKSNLQLPVGSSLRFKQGTFSATYINY